jgi:hypothetical protein
MATILYTFFEIFCGILLTTSITLFLISMQFAKTHYASVGWH